MLPPASSPAPAGAIEAHPGLLTLPAPGQLIYKVMRLEYLLHSIAEHYLHFNRVDAYADFPEADANDGAQLPADYAGNDAARFQRDPNFTAASYYDKCRSRTYACCFSLEITDHIWHTYGEGDSHGKVAVVFDFEKLRQHLNTRLRDSQLLIDGEPCTQIFSVDYGIVKYVDWDLHRANAEHLPHPIQYIYLKAARFNAEKELRISLSAPGIGDYAIGGKPLVFRENLQAPFDFQAAIKEGCIQQILYGADCDTVYAQTELSRLGIEPA